MTEFNKAEIQRLLDGAGSIIEKYEAIYRETGKNFNIFDIARIEDKEVIICRVLAELLNPKGRHGQRSEYLKIFLRDCLDFGVMFSDNEIEKMKVTTEHYTDEGRPIDLVIEYDGVFIPIEVKIFASDQPQQCYDYCMFARKSDKKAKIVYLTRFGDAPSEYSVMSADGKKKLNNDDMILLAFKEHILPWLEKCLALPDTIRKTPIREILIQFIMAIEKITDKSEDKPMNEIKEVLFKSEHNMRNAYAITDTLTACEDDMRKKFFNAFCEKFNKSEHLVEISQHREYDEHESRWPGVYYIIRPGVESINLTFYLQAESPHTPLYAGFQFMKDGETVNDDIDMMRHLTKYFTGIKASDSKKWAIFQEYLSFENEGIYLMNIRKSDNNYFKLFDPGKFHQIIDETVKQVNTMLSKLKFE